MKRIVIAGGIGAGKTAVATHLTTLGWPVIDADEIAHEVTQPGLPAFVALRDGFGDAILTPEGTLDRKFLAEVVFHDRPALQRLNRITHGHIGAEMVRRLGEVTGPAAFVAVPLFRPEHRALLEVDEVWAVLVQPETALERLCNLRGFSSDDAKARLASQMSNAERTAIVDRVFWNEGTLEELYGQVDKAMTEIGLTRG